MHHRAAFSLPRDLAGPAIVGLLRLSFALAVLLFLLTANQASAGLIFSSETAIGGDSTDEPLPEAYNGQIRQMHQNNRVTDLAREAFPSGDGTSSCISMRVVTWPALLPSSRQLPTLEPIASLARNDLLLFLSGPISERLRPPRAS